MQQKKDKRYQRAYPLLLICQSVSRPFARCGVRQRTEGDPPSGQAFTFI